MAGETTISWTNRVWNPLAGCSVLSPGCKRCYAMTMAARHEAMMAAVGKVSAYAGLTAPTKAGPVWTGEMRLVEAALALPLRWRKPRLIFVNSMSDLFHEDVPDAWIDRVYATMALTPQHTYQVLTKRPERRRAYLTDPNRVSRMLEVLVDHPTGPRPLVDLVDFVVFRAPLPNVWEGTSVEDQDRLADRLPELLGTPAVLRWISAEPLLEEIDIGAVVRHALFEGRILSDGKTHPLGWVVAGDESGRGRRLTGDDAFRRLRDDLAAAGVPFFLKQRHIDGRKVERPPLDGVVHDAFPVPRDLQMKSGF